MAVSQSPAFPLTAAKRVAEKFCVLEWGGGNGKARYLPLVLIQLPLLLIRADAMGAVFPREELAALGQQTWEIFHVEIWFCGSEARSDLIVPSRDKGLDNP